MAKSHRWRTQSELSECGLACVAVCLQELGADVDLATLRQKFLLSSRGLTFKEIAGICSSLDLATRAVRCELSEIKDLATPAILHWNFNHFVVLLDGPTRGKYRIVDPTVGERTIDTAELSRSFTGIALEVTSAPGFKKRKERSALSVWSLIPFKDGIGSSLAQAVLISLLLQIYVVASPFFLQLAIDEAALKGDLGLLATLAIGFALFAVLNATAESLRGLVLLRVSSMLSWDMTARLFHHMVRLPLAWFQRRRLADALTRFDSLDPIRNLIANGFVAGVLDGALSIVLLVAMLVYAQNLALIVLGLTALSCLVKLASIPRSIQLAVKALQASIAEKGKRIETLRAMQTIKLMGGEADRERDWANKFSETIVTTQKSGSFQIVVRSVQSVIDSLGLVLIIYFGAKNVLGGALSVGMLYAFLSFRTQFSSRVTNFVDQVVAWRMLDLHSERLADIALQKQEEGLDGPRHLAQELDGDLELANVSFRYASFEPYVFRNVSARIAPGELVAIVGPSGVGKSTLLKALIGLYPATSGEVRVDGLPIATVGHSAFRASLGVVMQDDELLSGSIAENVSFFDENVDADWIWKCLTLAAVDDEVRQMPMQQHTLIGDMGSSLSGGQKQRLLLARALYRRPRILVLDEATSNLDVARERKIHDSLKALSITRVVVTHRPETMRMADRVLMLDRTGLREMRKPGEHREDAVTAGAVS